MAKGGSGNQYTSGNLTKGQTYPHRQAAAEPIGRTPLMNQPAPSEAGNPNLRDASNPGVPYTPKAR